VSSVWDINVRHWLQIAAQNPAVSAYVLSIVTAEASAEMAQIVGIRLPVHFHLGKGGAPGDLLHFSNGVANLQLLGLGNVRVFALVKVIQAFGNSLDGSVAGGVEAG
jgi:hypothetical protein